MPKKIEAIVNSCEECPFCYDASWCDAVNLEIPGDKDCLYWKLETSFPDFCPFPDMKEEEILTYSDMFKAMAEGKKL